MRTVTAALMLAAAPLTAQIYTKSYDAARTSETRVESILSPAGVAKGMTMLPRIPCIGDARGCEAQPLIDTLGAGGAPPTSYQVMILASDGNVIRGVNPDGGAALWQTPQLCVPVKSIPGNDMWRVQTNFGMLSTGVIDADTHKLYQVATCSADGTGSQQSMQQRLFVVDTRTGRVLSQSALDATSNSQSYSASPRKQRAALALWNVGGVKFVAIAAGSFTESGPNATGWLMMYDTYDNRIKASLAFRAGVWGSGQGPAIDDDGTIYLGTGNGLFNGTTDFGESALKIKFTPPTATTTASLNVVGDFVPFLDSQRECTKAALSMPLSQVNAITGTAPGAKMAMMEGRCDSVWTDQDAHLTWTLVKRFHQFISAGKDGIGMVIPTQSFPQTAPGDFNTIAGRRKNCALVDMYEFGWNLGVPPCPDDPTVLNQMWNGNTRHQHGPPPQFTAPDGTFYLFFSGENSPVQAWKADAAGKYHYVARTDMRASSAVANGMPGSFCSVSDNNGANGILWCSVPDGDANRTVTTGRLYAFDLTQLSSGRLPQLWRSDSYTYSKFSQPIVWNGIVILPDYAGSVMEWKLAQTGVGY